MTRILFLHHQQRRHFKEEPGYNEVFRVFKSSGHDLETREFVYQTILLRLAELHFTRLPETMDQLERIKTAWVEANGAFAPILEQVVEIEHPDIIVNIMTFGTQSIHPEVFALLRQRGHRFKTVTVFFDLEESDPLIVLCLKLNLMHSDLVLLADDYFAYQRVVERQGVFSDATNVDRALWLPFAVDTKVFTKRDLEKSRDISLFGSSEGQRIEFIRQLSENFTNQFEHLGGYMTGDTFLSFDDYARAINQSKIIVNTQTSTRRDQVKGRVKEVLACGTFLLEQDTPNTRRFLEGSGVILFSDFDDLRNKIRYFLNHEREREDIAAKTRQWMLARYSPQIYVSKIIEALNR